MYESHALVFVIQGLMWVGAPQARFLCENISGQSLGKFFTRQGQPSTELEP